MWNARPAQQFSMKMSSLNPWPTLFTLQWEKHLMWDSTSPVQSTPTTPRQFSSNITAKQSPMPQSSFGKIWNLVLLWALLKIEYIFKVLSCQFIFIYLLFPFSAFACLLIALALGASIIDIFLKNNKELFPSDHQCQPERENSHLQIQNGEMKSQLMCQQSPIFGTQLFFYSFVSISLNLTLGN